MRKMYLWIRYCTGRDECEFRFMFKEKDGVTISNVGFKVVLAELEPRWKS
jgi:hypothetical protein